MHYPQDFPTESVTKVEKARIQAGRQFDSKGAKAKWKSDIEVLFWKYVLTPFLVFAHESARLDLWPADKMDRNCREFLRLLTIDAYSRKGRGAGLLDMIDSTDGSILRRAVQEIEKTFQWRKYENIRLKFDGSGRPTTQSVAQNSDKKTQNAAAAGNIPTPSKKHDPEAAKRRALVKSNAGVSVRELCVIFDREKVPLPAKWQAAGLKSWAQAYKDPIYRKRTDVIIAKDKRKN